MNRPTGAGKGRGRDAGRPAMKGTLVIWKYVGVANGIDRPATRGALAIRWWIDVAGAGRGAAPANITLGIASSGAKKKKFKGKKIVPTIETRIQIMKSKMKNRKPNWKCWCSQTVTSFLKADFQHMYWK